MKRLICLVCFFFLLTGCGSENRELNTVLQIREKIQSSESCSFTATVTADYTDEIYVFTMDCQFDDMGNMSFTVVQPETIAGISGMVVDSGGKLTFDDKVLAFETLADGLVVPVSAPWLMMKTLRGGYIIGAGKDEDGIHAVIHDTYDEQALTLDFWFSENGSPDYCQILWQGRRILSMEVENFVVV